MHRSATRLLLTGLLLAGGLAPGPHQVAAQDGADSCPPAARLVQMAELANRDSDAGAAIQRQRWEALIAAHQACRDVAAEAAALGAWGEHAIRRLARDEALAIENTRYALASRAGLDYQRAEAAARLGVALGNRGEADLARRRLREASSTFESLGAWSEAADAQSRLSRMNRMDGDYLAALTDEKMALAFRRRLDPPPNAWRSLQNLAILYEQLELPDDARRRYAEALDEAEREGNEASVVVVLSGFAGFLSDFGAAHAVQALAMAERAASIAKRLDVPIQASSALLQVGRAQTNLGHLQAADGALVDALAFAARVQSEPMRAHILLRHGELAQLQGDLPLALQRIEQARALYEAQDNRHRLVKVHTALELLYAAMGDELSAARSGRERFRLRDELIGAKASGKLGELLSRFELSEERRRSDRLAQENAVTELTLVAGRQQLRTVYLVVAAIGTALLLLAWRHVTARRLYHLLHRQNQVMLEQAAQLKQANQQLTEQSQRLYQASTTDALTGVHNRAYGMQRLHEQLQAGGSSRQSAVVIIDIDHFKAINDRYGHPGGDALLVAAARVLQQALPDGAELSRVGGEEFMVLLPDIDSRQAFDIGNALRAQVRAASVERDGQRVSVTISVGICLVDADTETPAQQAYAYADAALYRAKRSGRDCVCMHTASSVSTPVY